MNEYTSAGKIKKILREQMLVNFWKIVKKHRWMYEWMNIDEKEERKTNNYCRIYWKMKLGETYSEEKRKYKNVL